MQAGGDFAASVSASTTVGGIDDYVWSSARMVVDVQSWLDNASTQFGWLLKGGESTNGSAHRFDSREHPMAGFRPQLTIDFTPSNAATTDIGLDNLQVAEDVDTSTAVTVGNLKATDPDAGDTHPFSLVSGSGADDNGLFQINGAKLEIRPQSLLNHESQSQLKVRLAATDNGGLSVERSFIIEVTDVNESPVVSRSIDFQFASPDYS